LHHRRSATFSAFPPDLKLRLLAWADAHDTAAYFDSNDYPAVGGHRSWDCLVAAGAVRVLEAPAGSAFAQLSAWQHTHAAGDWLFGGFSYDLKNEVESLRSRHPDGIGWPDLCFFQPRTVVGIRGAQVEVHAWGDTDPAAVWADILATAPAAATAVAVPVALKSRFSQEEYCATVERIRARIAAGDLYELNFCQEFFAENALLEPLATFVRLNALARAPFAAYLRHDGRFLLSASPERFLRKEGQRLITQPIKGTRRRSSDPAEDAQIKAQLAADPKDRAENVMIVDLVRNDLARHCLPGSVRVDELFGIHTFPTVHQMISTVSGTLRPDTTGLAALRDAFPMGSMTGAPKVMALVLAERYERTRRGWYSGAVGYSDPAGDFDFNVVIRSIQYHAATQYVSCSVGGAIVYDSVPELEYEECLVKLAVLRRVLLGQ
jgi:para-aminobenzoate synthetase component 1